jgi:hypothetical protein
VEHSFVRRGRQRAAAIIARMRRGQIVALSAVLLLAALVAYLALRTRQPPQLPADRDHARFTTPVACLACHGSDGVLPQSKNHPVRNDCLNCHGGSA